MTVFENDCSKRLLLLKVFSLRFFVVHLFVSLS